MTERNLDKVMLNEFSAIDDYQNIYTVETIGDKVKQLLEEYENVADQFINQVRL